MNPWLGIATVLAALGGLLLLVLLLRRFGMGGEACRKSVHVGMGLICSAFPLLFHAAWPVWALAVVATLLLLPLRLPGPLRRHLGGALHDVERQSYGEVLFPWAVALTWWLSDGVARIYCPAILVLALADAAAALIGTRFGRRRYTTEEGFKSWEGSLTFALVAAVVILVARWDGLAEAPLHLGLLAGAIAFLVMLLEATAWRGLDNLFIPIGVCAFLLGYETVTSEQLLIRMLTAALLVVVCLTSRRRNGLDDAALMGTALIIYGMVFIAGDWRIAIAPLIMLYTYAHFAESGRDWVDDIREVLIIGLPCLLLPLVLPQQWWWPLHAWLLGHLLGIAGNQSSRQGSTRPLRCLLSTVAICLLPAMTLRWRGDDLLIGLALLAPAWLGYLAFMACWRRSQACRPWRWQVEIACALTVAALLLQQLVCGGDMPSALALPRWLSW